jgi:hypothetical protein
MATPYYTKQPVFLEDTSGRFGNILSNAPDGMDNPNVYDKKNTATRLNFPYTPTISIINSANYSSYELTHSNFQQRAFDSHTNMEINITAPMIVRSEEEALYVYNAALWIRSTMKMSWMKDDNPGMPPPILRFNAHGVYENVPCVIRDFTWNLDSDIDYVEIPTTLKGAEAMIEQGHRLKNVASPKKLRIPVTNMFVLSLSVTYTPKSIREDFSVKDYLAGNLKDKGYV